MTASPEMDRCNIRGGYRINPNPWPHDDRLGTDEYQDEVYAFARRIFNEHSLTTVLDIGCGSGFKLMKYFVNVDTTGVESPQTLKFLREKYPDRKWLEAGAVLWPKTYDLIIAADVIEHIIDPTPFVAGIRTLKPKYLAISTPDRNVWKNALKGPPVNSCHVREWTMPEFRNYMSRFFTVEEHFISNQEQGTQCMLCTGRVE